MPIGRVKWFSLEKGFGFVESDEGADVYLSASALPEGVATCLLYTSPSPRD